MISIATDETNVNIVKEFFTDLRFPITKAMVTSLSKEGEVEIGVFEFYHISDSHPPKSLLFVPNNDLENAKNTLQNLIFNKQCVINLPDEKLYKLLDSTCKSHFLDLKVAFKDKLVLIESHFVEVPRLQDFPVQCECVVNHIIPMGDYQHTVNLIMLETKVMHKQELDNSTIACCTDVIHDF